jgi:hypothetical protein
MQTTQTSNTRPKQDLATLAAMTPDQFFLANVGGVPYREWAPNVGAGVYYVGNDTGRFDSAYFSEPLTAYAAGWVDEDKVEELLNFIAPVVPVPNRFEFTRWTNPEAFLSETDDIRSIDSDFKRVKYSQAKVQDRTYNKGLTMRIDLDEWGGVPNYKEKLTGYLLKRIVRNDLQRAWTLMGTTYAPTGGMAVTKTWSNGSTDKDPDSDVIDGVDAFGDVMGLNANRVLFGFTAWKHRLRGYGIQNTAAGFGGRAVQTPEALANVLGVDKVYISKERYQSAAATKAKLITNNVVFAFRANDGLLRDDPSTFKRFVTMAGGQTYRVYEVVVPPGKFVDLTVEHYSNIVHTGTGVRGATTYDGLYKITVS